MTVARFLQHGIVVPTWLLSNHLAGLQLVIYKMTNILIHYVSTIEFSRKIMVSVAYFLHNIIHYILFITVTNLLWNKIDIANFVSVFKIVATSLLIETHPAPVFNANKPFYFVIKAKSESLFNGVMYGNWRDTLNIILNFVINHWNIHFIHFCVVFK